MKVSLYKNEFSFLLLEIIFSRKFPEDPDVFSKNNFIRITYRVTSIESHFLKRNTYMTYCIFDYFPGFCNKNATIGQN